MFLGIRESNTKELGLDSALDASPGRSYTLGERSEVSDRLHAIFGLGNKGLAKRYVSRVDYAKLDKHHWSDVRTVMIPVWQ